MSVTLLSSVGPIDLELFTHDRPKACYNFLKLCKAKHYHGSKFHFVQKDFVAQTGDPTGIGQGGDSMHILLDAAASRFFEREVRPKLSHSKKGTLSMAGSEHAQASQAPARVLFFANRAQVAHERLGSFISLRTSAVLIKHTLVLLDPFDDSPELIKVYPSISPEGKPRDEVLSSNYSIRFNFQQNPTQNGPAIIPIPDSTG
ncbi:hypothetical protein CTI12_AA033430 [Artemisia annua]|uniref:PPIase cyclophilin-type domain-containing protein n=1 Tax=Artemisia annua TaxID=35608 RepID=A0A2U1QFL9_ARTAN|nr:hypothetical protein CTI12_AA033430 [Artemisia annua]